jgi:hypothetical protein
MMFQTRKKIRIGTNSSAGKNRLSSSVRHRRARVRAGARRVVSIRSSCVPIWAIGVPEC